MYTQKVKGNENTLYWCGEEDSHPIEGLEGEQLDENDDFEEARPWMSAYLLLSLAVGFLDFTLLLAIWSAAGVGTPTQPMGRDKFLRPLLRTKIFVVTFLTLTLVIIGICMVHFFRQISWGCDPEFGPGEGFEATGLFTLFSVILVLQALEVFVLPAILVAKATGWIKRHDPVFQMKQETRVKSLDSCLTGCFKCCGFLCCKKTDMANTGELRDAADAALDFFGSTVNLTWSDLYFAIKLLARVQLERRIESIQLATSAQQSYNDDDKCVKTKTLLTGKMPIAPEKDEGALVEGDGSRRAGTRKSLSVRTFKRDDDTETMYNLITRYVLMPKTMKDITLVRDAIRHAKHSQVSAKQHVLFSNSIFSRNPSFRLSMVICFML